MLEKKALAGGFVYFYYQPTARGGISVPGEQIYQKDSTLKSSAVMLLPRAILKCIHMSDKKEHFVPQCNTEKDYQMPNEGIVMTSGKPTNM